MGAIFEESSSEQKGGGIPTFRILSDLAPVSDFAPKVDKNLAEDCPGAIFSGGVVFG